MRARCTALAAAALVLTALAVPAHPAQADEPTPTDPPAGAPVTTADRVTVALDSGTEIDVLANDTDPDDPAGADLAVCRLEPAVDGLMVFPSTGYDETGEHPVLDVFAFGVEPGTYAIPYYVCDYDYLTPATLTVKVIPSQDPTATIVASRPGYVRFDNPGKRRAVIQFGSVDGRTVDDRFPLKPGTGRTVRVRRHAILWTAAITTPQGGHGFGSILRGIKQPPHSSRPVGTTHVARTRADRTAWRLGREQVMLRHRAMSTSAAPQRAVARDEAGDAPVTAPDSVEASQGFFGVAEVLDNDSDPDGDSADLAVCRTSAPRGSGVQVSPILGIDGEYSIGYVEVLGRRTDEPAGVPTYAVVAFASDKTPVGTYEVTYYACDHQYLTPATLTVEVTPSEKVVGHKVKGRPGVVRFTNPGPSAAHVAIRDVSYLYGERAPVVLSFALPPGTSKSVRPHLRRIYWSARARRGPGGAGIITGIGGATRD